MAKTKIKLNDNEQKCLEVLASSSDIDFYIPFDYIGGDINLSYKEVRVAVRSLARKGLAEYMRGLMTEEGQVAGSGYSATTKGRDLILD